MMFWALCKAKEAKVLKLSNNLGNLPLHGEIEAETLLGMLEKTGKIVNYTAVKMVHYIGYAGNERSGLV